MDNFKKSTDTIFSSIQKQKVFINPIIDHQISRCELEVQNIYFIVLSILGNTNNSLNKNQDFFMQRLLISATNNQKIEDYNKLATEITEQFTENLINNFQDKSIKYNLLGDMLILLGLSDERNQQQVQLISEIAMILKIKLQEVKLLTKIAKAIIEQDNRIIADLAEVNDNLAENFICYLKDFYSGAISFNAKSIYCISEEDNKISFSSLPEYRHLLNNEYTSFAKTIQMSFEKDLEIHNKKSMRLSSEKIVFENCFLISEDLEIEIANTKLIKFVNCEFERSLITPITIKKCGDVIFDNCKFTNIDITNIYLNNIDDVIFKNCTFESSQTSKLINFENINSIELSKCVFNKITFKNLTESIITIFDWPFNMNIHDNKFIKCKNMSGFGALLLYSDQEPKKENKIAIDNNKFEKCYSHSVIKSQGIMDKNYKSNKSDNDINFLDGDI